MFCAASILLFEYRAESKTNAVLFEITRRIPIMHRSFRQLVCGRRSVRSFDGSVPIEKAALLDSLSLCQRAPSGFNLQPYKVILVQDQLVRKQLAYTMISGNIKRVLDAPATAVFLADLKPTLSLEKLEKIEREVGASENDMANLASDARFCLGASPELTDDSPGSFVGDSVKRSVEDKAIQTELASKRLLLSLISTFTQAPTLNSSNEAWAFKNTMLAAQIFMLAITAHGYDSCPMEGFDATRMKEVLSVPEHRFSIPIVVSIGKSNDTRSKNERPRFQFEDVFCKDTFDFPLFKDDLES